MIDYTRHGPMTADNPPLVIRVALRVTVDANAWRAEYATRETRAMIRESVRATTLEAVQMAYAHISPAVRVEDDR